MLHPLALVEILDKYIDSKKKQKITNHLTRHGRDAAVFRLVLRSRYNYNIFTIAHDDTNVENFSKKRKSENESKDHVTVMTYCFTLGMRVFKRKPLFRDSIYRISTSQNKAHQGIELCLGDSGKYKEKIFVLV